MSDADFRTVLKISSDGDPSGVDRMTESLERLRSSTSGAGESLAGAARSSDRASSRLEAAGKAAAESGRRSSEAADAHGRAARRAAADVDALSSSSVDSVRKIGSFAAGLASGFGIFAALTKLYSAWRMLKEHQDAARDSAVKAAVELERSVSAAALQRVRDMAAAQREAAEAVERQAEGLREVARARAEAEDSAFGQRISDIDLAEAEEISQIPSSDAVGRARTRYRYSGLRRQAGRERDIAAAEREADSAAQLEREAAGKVTRMRDEAVSGKATEQAMLVEIRKLREFLADPQAVSLAGQRAWRDSGGAGGLSGLGNTVAAVEASARERLSGMVTRRNEIVRGVNTILRGPLQQAEAEEEAARIRSQTASGRLAALRASRPALDVAQARTEYQGVTEAEQKEAERAAEAERKASERAALLAQADALTATAGSAQTVVSESGRRADLARVGVQQRARDLHLAESGLASLPQWQRGMQPGKDLSAQVESYREQLRQANEELARALAEYGEVSAQALETARRAEAEAAKLRTRAGVARIDAGNID